MAMNVLKFAFIVYFMLMWVVSHCDNEEKMPVIVAAEVGSWAVFDCELDFPQYIPIPYIINWKKDGETIFSVKEGKSQEALQYKDRIQLLEHPNYGKASVNLSDIRESDKGWYECQIVFPNRSPPIANCGTWFILSVNGGYLLALVPINVTIMEGSDAEFTCVKKNSTTEITWYKDSTPITKLTDIFRRSWISRLGSLTIRQTTMDDMGEFKCEAVSSNGEIESAIAFLNVTYKAKVIYAPKEIYLSYGKTAMLDCHYRANPPLTRIRWDKDEVHFDPYRHQGVHTMRNGSLFFSKIDESHKGYYTCTPFNMLGTDGPSPSIRVVVQKPPMFVVIPPKMYKRRLGESVKIACDATDSERYHKPMIVWYKNDRTSLPTGRYSIRDGILTITNIQEQDMGVYQCAAINEAGAVTTETEIAVKNVTHEESYNITGLAHSNSVHLTWTAAVNRRSSEYSVLYKPVESMEWKIKKISVEKSLETTIFNLDPDCEYEFMILSKDDEGNILFNNWISVRTETIQVAQNVREKLTSPFDVNIRGTRAGYLLSWRPPANDLEELKIYIIRWFEKPNKHVIGMAETKDTSYLITNLKEGIDYKFQVTAIFFSNYQSGSEELHFKTPSYTNTRTLSTGGIIGVVFVVLVLIVASIYFAKKKCCGPSGVSDKKPSI